MTYSSSESESKVQLWLESVVVGLNLCPFARKPFEDARIRIVSELATEYDSVLERMLGELRYLHADVEHKVETSLIVVPNTLHSFDDYLCCLGDVNEMLVEQGYEGEFQVASFHPLYQFEGTSSKDRSNLTNRSPFPIFHIIRESTLESILENYPDVDSIPERNINLMETMDDARLASLFPWIYTD